MRKLYGEGVASHTGRESCGAGRETCLEAMTAVHAGAAIEPRKYVQDADPVPVAGRPHDSARYCERTVSPAGSMNRRTRGTFVHENRETSDMFVRCRAWRTARWRRRAE